MLQTDLLPETEIERQIYGWFFEIAKPDPLQSVSDWSDENRVLSSMASSSPGKWRTSKTPYLREIMDCLGVLSPVEEVDFMKGAQIGGTEAGLNWIGYVVDRAPGPMLLVNPTVDIAKRTSKQRLTPLFTESPSLSSKVKESRSRDSGNTIMSKEFPGGMLMLAGANSAAGLRSMPIRYLFPDEVDAYPSDVEGEGDPVELAKARTRTFARRKIFLCSTPTIKGTSRIEAAYNETEQSRYFVPCPDPACGHMHILEWKNFIIPKFADGSPNWRAAHMVCPSCGLVIENHQKSEMLKEKGYGGLAEWRATCPEKAYKKRRGFHLSALYSPVGWFSWPEIAEKWVNAQGNPLKLKEFINTILGETWEEKGESVDHTGLMARAEDYSADPLPDGVVFITVGVDVQRDRIELEFVGWGEGEETWSLDYSVLYGNTAELQVYELLDMQIARTFKHTSGVMLRAFRTFVDSGDGVRIQEVYNYTKPREHMGVFACKGMPGDNKPIACPPSKVGTDKTVTLIPIGTNAAKDMIYGRLRLQDPGPGYCHFSKRYGLEYFEQLTAEEARIKKNAKGFDVREYHKKRPRNEALDCRVYAYGALYSTELNVDQIAEAFRNMGQPQGGRRVRGTSQ